MPPFFFFSKTRSRCALSPARRARARDRRCFFPRFIRARAHEERHAGACSTRRTNRPAAPPPRKTQKTKTKNTVYGDDGGTTINQGSCEYYNLDFHKGTGWDIVALSDTAPDYSGSCGKCYEVQCVSAKFTDGYGAELDRTSTCRDGGKGERTVIVTVTDTCPCVYPSNQYSNKRWCCGDRPHIDLSTQAFRKLGNTAEGVMAARWRRVACPDRPTYLDWDGDEPKQGGGGGSRRMLNKAPWAP